MRWMVSRDSATILVSICSVARAKIEAYPTRLSSRAAGQCGDRTRLTISAPPSARPTADAGRAMIRESATRDRRVESSISRRRQPEAASKTVMRCASAEDRYRAVDRRMTRAQLRRIGRRCNQQRSDQGPGTRPQRMSVHMCYIQRKDDFLRQPPPLSPPPPPPPIFLPPLPRFPPVPPPAPPLRFEVLCSPPPPPPGRSEATDVKVTAGRCPSLIAGVRVMLRDARRKK